MRPNSNVRRRKQISQEISCRRRGLYAPVCLFERLADQLELCLSAISRGRSAAVARKTRTRRAVSGQSCRKATMGSTREARRAGTYPAIEATAKVKRMMPIMVPGSAALRPKN